MCMFTLMHNFLFSWLAWNQMRLEYSGKDDIDIVFMYSQCGEDWKQVRSPQLCPFQFHSSNTRSVGTLFFPKPKVENAGKEPFKHEEPLCCTNQVEKGLDEIVWLFSPKYVVPFLTLFQPGQVQEVWWFRVWGYLWLAWTGLNWHLHSFVLAQLRTTVAFNIPAL